jgi:radical SAM protein with 4Fe4S-binding SPASM domain
MMELFLKAHEKLPVFQIENGPFQIIYTPGYSVTFPGAAKQELKSYLACPDKVKDRKLQASLLHLLKTARQNQVNWEYRREAPFSPECLTIHAGSECNLNCEYCYTRRSTHLPFYGFPGKHLIEKALGFAFLKSPERTRRMTVVYHGAGEPSFHWDQLVESFNSISLFARINRIKLFTYLATNGALSRDKVVWLSKHIDETGISCDGPPCINDKQRPNIQPADIPISEICKLILSTGGRFSIRATITPSTVEKQLQIVKYFIHECYATRIRIEPVYLVPEGFQPGQSQTFFENYIEARDYARHQGVTVDYSGVRLHEPHGPYCEVLRNTIRLTPQGQLINCFCPADEEGNDIMGQFNEKNAQFEWSRDIRKLKKEASVIPEACVHCINIYHCSRGCPDFCIHMKETSARGKLNDFKCHLNQLIGVHMIKEQSNIAFPYEGH